jgi:hypothetical protein
MVVGLLVFFIFWQITFEKTFVKLRITSFDLDFYPAFAEKESSESKDFGFSLIQNTCTNPPTSD